MAPPQQLNISDANSSEKVHRFWASARMAYTICAFLAVFLHHTLRSAVSVSILCMVAEQPKSSINSTIRSGSTLCKTPNETSLNERKGDLLWTRDQEIYFPGIFFYGFILAMPFAGLLADKYGGRALFISSLTLESAIFMLIPVCARYSFWLGASSRLLQGAIAGIGNPAIYELYTKWAHPTELAASIAFGYCGFNIANLMVYPLSVWLCSFGWDMIFYVIGPVSFALGCIMNWFVYNSIDDHPRITSEEYFYLKAVQKPKSKKHKVPWKSILTCIPFYAFIFTHFFHSFGAAMEALMLPRYFKEALSFTISESGIFTSVVYVGSVISKVVVIIVSSQVDKKMSLNLDLFRRLLHLCCCWSAIPFVIVIIILTCKDRWIVLTLWVCVCMTTHIAFAGGYWPSISFLAPSYSGLLIGIANCIGSTGAILVPTAVSKLVPTGDAEEWSGALGILTIVFFIDGLLFAVFGSSKLQLWGQ